MEGQNVTWNNSLGCAPNYTGYNGIPIPSIPVSTQFPRTVNFSSHLNALMYPIPHIFPHNTSVGKNKLHCVNCVC